MYISLELVQQLVRDLKEDLMRDAVRSIRQKKPEQGIASVAEIDGVDKLSGAISQASCSMVYQQQGHVVVEFPAVSPAPPPSNRRKLGSKVTSLPAPASAIRKRQKVQTISAAASGE